ILSFWGSAGEGSGYILPHHKSRSYIESCSASLSIRISHLLYDSNLFHKKAGAFSEDSGSRSGHGQVLTGRTAADDVHRRQLCSVKLCNVAHMNHIGKSKPGHLNRKGFDLTGPHRYDAAVNRGQGKTAYPIKQAAHRQRLHLATA